MLVDRCDGVDGGIDDGDVVVVMDRYDGVDDGGCVDNGGVVMMMMVCWRTGVWC